MAERDEEQLSFDEQIRSAIETKGGPQQFTVEFLRSIQGVAEDELSEEESAIVRSMQKAGDTGAFVERLRSFYGVPDALPGGGPTASFVEPTPITQLLGEGSEAAAGALTGALRSGADLGEESEQPSFVTSPLRAATALPGELLTIGAGLLAFPISIGRKLATGDLKGAARELTGLEMQSQTVEGVVAEGLQPALEERPISTILGALGPVAVALPFAVKGARAVGRRVRGRAAAGIMEAEGVGVGKAAEEVFQVETQEVARLSERFAISRRLNAIDEQAARLVDELQQPEIQPEALDALNRDVAALRVERERLQRRRHGLDRSREVEVDFTDPEAPVVRPAPEKPLNVRLLATEPIRLFPTRQGRRRVARRIPAQEEALATTAADEIARLHSENGGVTFVPQGGVGALAIGSQGDVVSLFPERTKIVPGRQLTPEQTKAFVLQNRDLLLRDDPRHAVGSWYDEAGDQTYLDVSVVLPEGHLGASVGRAANQRSIFRLSTGEEIKLGGSGEFSSAVVAALGPERGRLARVLATAPKEEPVLGLADGTTVSVHPTAETAASAGIIAADGVVAQATVRHPTLRALLGSVNPTADVIRAFRDIPRLWHEAISRTQPTNFQVIMKTDPELGRRAGMVMAARSHAQTMRVRFTRDLRRILRSSRTIDDFVRRYWIGEQLEATEGGKGRIQIDPEIVARMDADPRIQTALAYVRENITPFLERLAPDAGVDAFRRTPNGYMKLYPGRREGGEIVFSDGRRMRRGETVFAAEGTRTINPFALTRQRARAARRASGTAEVYSADMDAILEHAIYDRLSTGSRNLLFERLREIGTPHTSGDLIPPGRRPIWIPAEGAEAGSLRLERFSVPEDVAALYNTTLKPFVLPDGSLPVDVDAMGAISRTFTAANLIGLGDTVWSFMFTASTVYGELGGRSFRSRSLGALAQLPLHIPRIALSLAKIMNTHGKEARAWADELSLVGSLRGRQIAELADAVGWKAALPWRAFAKLGFGLPEFERGVLGGRGIGGWDVRGRVALAQILEAEHPNLTRAQIAALINDRAGAYVPGLRAPLATSLMKSIVVTDPYASRFVAGFKNTARTTAGLNSRGFSPALLGNSLVGVGLSAVLINRALNGRWPWDEPDLKPGDIRIRMDDGSIHDMPFGKWAFTVARATAPTREAWNTYAQGGSLGEVSLAFARSSVNTLLARMSPAIDFFHTAVTGRTSFITAGGELMKVAREGSNQLKENLNAALRGLLQAPDAWLGLDPETLAPTPEAQQEQTALSLMELFGLAPRRRPPEVALIGARVRREKGHRRRIAADVAFRTRERFDINPDLDIVMEAERLLHSRGVLPDATDYYETLGLTLRIFKAASRGRERAAEEALSEDIEE